jgi:hypothetical protein
MQKDWVECLDDGKETIPKCIIIKNGRNKAEAFVVDKHFVNRMQELHHFTSHPTFRRLHEIQIPTPIKKLCMLVKHGHRTMTG